jgi:4-hydroxy-tetrahydrodipicolinate synthase
MKPLRGTLTALITPFRNGRVDYAALEAHVERQIAAGVEGLVPCGTTGESPTLSEDEQRDIVTCVVKTTRGRVPVVAGSGSNNTARALEMARRNERCGADALLVVAPYYNRPSQEGLFQHFSAISGATALPIMLYNIPGRCGVEISVDTIKRLIEAHRNIVAVKHATGSVAGAVDLAAECEIEILAGDDLLTLPLMSLGAVGVVSAISNLVPAAMKRLTAAAAAGDLAAARAAHEQLYPLMKTLGGLDTNPIPVKTACALKGWCAEEFRLPLCPLPPEKRAVVQRLVASP